MKAEQTSIVTVRFSAAVMCFFASLLDSTNAVIVSARKLCLPIVRAVLSHHRLCALLWPRGEPRGDVL